VIPGALLALWWASYGLGWTESRLFVPIESVLLAGVRLVGDGELLRALGASLQRMAAGFAVGAAAGLCFGVALGLSRPLERLVGPTFHTIKQVSLFAWLPLISLWFGLGELSKIVFISLAAFFPVALNAFDGVRSVPRELIEVARALELSRVQTIRRVVLPAASPALFTGLALALIYAWLGTLGAEYLMTAGPGIGNLLTDGREHFWMDVVILGVVVIGLVGFALTWITGVLESRLLRWRGESRAQSSH
jgi:sulfonate transport system permease protein